jgi:hypothetical protein
MDQAGCEYCGLYLCIRDEEMSCSGVEQLQHLFRASNYFLIAQYLSPSSSSVSSSFAIAAGGRRAGRPSRIADTLYSSQNSAYSLSPTRKGSATFGSLTLLSRDAAWFLKVMSAPDTPSISPSLTPDLIHYSNAHSLMAQAGSVFAVCTLTVLLRCYVRMRILKSFGSDDWTILLAYVRCCVIDGSCSLTRVQALALATFICYALEVPQGLGKHLLVIQMNKAAYRELLKIREIHMCCVTIGLSVVKISVSLLFLRLATRKLYRVFLWGVVAFMVTFGMASAGTLVCCDASVQK